MFVGNMKEWFEFMGEGEPYPVDPLERLTKVRQKVQEGFERHRRMAGKTELTAGPPVGIRKRP